MHALAEIQANNCLLSRLGSARTTLAKLDSHTTTNLVDQFVINVPINGGIRRQKLRQELLRSKIGWLKDSTAGCAPGEWVLFVWCMSKDKDIYN